MFKIQPPQLTSTIRLQHRSEVMVNGQPKIAYTDATPPLHPCEFKPFYGTEAIQAGQAGVFDGGTITLWYTPGVKYSDRVLLNNDPSLAYDVLGVENVSNRSLWLVLKVKRVVSA
jgi:hypothetical protein